MAWHHRLLNLARGDRHTRELDREMEFHLAERADELEAAGMPRDRAEREARRRFGNRTAIRERTRDVDVPAWLDSLAADVRYALRALKTSPGFAFVAVLSLGLGIGANTAIFSLINAVMLRPLPVHAPEELVQVTMGESEEYFTNPIWEGVRDRQDVFSGVFAFASERFNLATGGEARRVAGSWVSGAYFATMGVRPAVGRVLERGDDVRGCPATVVLSHAFWQSRYGGDPGVVGRTLLMEGHPFTIVGVAEAGFTGVQVGLPSQVYAPLCAEAAVRGRKSALEGRSTWWLGIIGRPREGISPAQARAGLAAQAPAVFAATVPGDFPPDAQRQYLRNTLSARPVSTGLSWVRQEYGGALLALMAVVGVVLLIACANVANLLLARAAARRREMAIRIAIGAGRARLGRQLLTESLILSLLGAAVGVLFARWASELLVRLLATGREVVWLDLSLDGRVLAFTLAAAAGTALLFGMMPAWRAARVDPQEALKARGPGDHVRRRLAPGKVLVVGQVALSLVLVTGAGLLLGSFGNLVSLDPGFRREGVLLVNVDLRGAPRSEERTRVLQRELLARLRAVPGVRSASASALTPISGAAWNGTVTVDGREPADGNSEVFFNAVSEGYLATMGTALLAGREVDARDRAGAPRVAVINETMARRYFGDANPLGKRFLLKPEGHLVEVVGVAEDARYRSLREETPATAYLPLGQESPMPFMTFELLSSGPPAALAPSAARAIGEVDGGLSLEFTTLSAQVEGSLARERLLATLSGFFGALALILAMMGLYGTLAYGVVRRKTEIGVRIALGARKSSVVRMVLGDAGRMVGAGLVLGTLAALGATRVVASFLYGVEARDLSTLVLSALLLGAVAVAAGAMPAWRAARLDPMVALREE